MGQRRDEGERIRRELFGDAYVEESHRAETSFNRPFYELLTEFTFGAIWSRPGLDRRTRCLLNIAMLTALNRPEQLRHHVRVALGQGCTPDELSEVLLQAAAYCGNPAAAAAYRIAQEEITAASRRP